MLAALQFARKRRATTIAITVNRNTPVARLAKILIATEVGPEVLTGSTRLKAGTSQKMVLNMLTTAAMARLGHVYENLMIDVKASNRKVSERMVRILADASGKSLSASEHALRQSGHNLRVALVMLKLHVGREMRRKRGCVARRGICVQHWVSSRVATDGVAAKTRVFASCLLRFCELFLMDKFLIKGGKALHGTVAISGAKNSALPVMAAALLTAEPVTLHNIPKVRDLMTMSKLLAFMSASVSVTEFPASDYVIQAPR